MSEHMTDEQAVRQVYPDAYAEQVGSDTVEILVCIGATPGRITSSITAAAWADARAKLPTGSATQTAIGNSEKIGKVG